MTSRNIAIYSDEFNTVILKIANKLNALLVKLMLIYLVKLFPIVGTTLLKSISSYLKIKVKVVTSQV